LIVAEKEISDDFYQQWNQIYKNASMSLSNREKLIDEAAARIEHDFELIGATAIEDKL
jgi:magnesium-transporting ATPase (P-type)